jgi:oligopeptide/dipeptide ABC transporter ATP-binding protein
MTSLAIMGLLPRAARVDEGQIILDGENLLDKGRDEMRRLRGARIGMIPQDPYGSLDPLFTIGNQIAEPLRMHRHLRGRDVRSASIASMRSVQIPSPDERLQSFPHQLSGGMRQRVTSAIALAGEPRLLIADEPTTALDMTTQAQYLTLLRQLHRTTGVTLLLITHDLLVVRHLCSRVVVMYAGQVVEDAPTKLIFETPQHPYTRALLAARPALHQRARLASIEGRAPDLADRIIGCKFAPRCGHSRDVCWNKPPQLKPREDRAQAVRCWGTEAGGWIRQ